jgi:hypothetical protein
MDVSALGIRLALARRNSFPLMVTLLPCGLYLKQRFPDVKIGEPTRVSALSLSELHPQLGSACSVNRQPKRSSPAAMPEHVLHTYG